MLFNQTQAVCNFAEAAYQDMIQRRYGINICCKLKIMDWYIPYSIVVLDKECKCACTC